MWNGFDFFLEKHTWEDIPASKKGAGKFYRKGIPGGWGAEDLTPEQVENRGRHHRPTPGEKLRRRPASRLIQG